MINVRAHGIIEVNGEEYSFIVRDGNWDGTVLEDWNTGAEFKLSPRTVWALQPKQGLIDDALHKGAGKILVEAWDAMLKNTEIAKIPGNYTYDIFHQPQGSIRTYYQTEAARYDFVIVPQEEAEATRKMLLAS